MTKRERARRLDALEGELTDATNGVDAAEWTVDHREAAPEKRPEGMVYDLDGNTLSYDFWGRQRDCLDHLDGGEQDIVGFLGGYRSGKTVTGARWVLSGALDIPGSRWLAMGQDYQKATGTTFRSLFESLPGERTHIVTSSFNGPEESPIVADYNRQEHRLTLFNDATIVLGSADKWSRYAGDEYSGVWLDEPSHYGTELHDLMEMMGTRLTADAGPKVMFWTLTGNGYGSAWEVLEKREDSGGNPLGMRITVERASVLDNPYIADEDKERLRRQFEGGGREDQALHGGFAAATGLVYSNFSRETHVIPHAEAVDRVTESGGWTRIFGYDAGWNDPRVLLEVGRTAYDQLVVLDEFHESNTHVDAAIRWLIENDKPCGTIYAEHVPGELEKFRGADYSAVKAEKSIDAGIAEVRRRLEPDGNLGIEDGPKYDFSPAEVPIRDGGEIDERVGLLISDRCENLIREFHGYKREEVGTSAAEDHCLDALRYVVMGSASAHTSKHAARQSWADAAQVGKWGSENFGGGGTGHGKRPSRSANQSRESYAERHKNRRRERDRRRR